MGSGTATYSTLYTQQLFSHTKTALVHTTVSQQNSDGGVILALEVHELLSKIQDILDNAIAKQFCNIAQTLVSPFNCASWHLMKSRFHISPFFII